MKDLHGRAYRNPKYIFFVIAAFLLVPCGARADAGVPMLPLAYQVILIFLVLVILIEAIYMWRKLHTAWWRTVCGVAIANGITMILGYPLMWLIYLLCEIILILPFALAANHLHLDSIPDNFATRLIGVVLGAAWMGPCREKNIGLCWLPLLSF